MVVSSNYGINFHNPSAMTKPANLHNSAVLRMLEEEESRQRNGQSQGAKRVAWPPPKDEEEEGDFEEQEAAQAQGQAQQQFQPQYKPAPVKQVEPPPSIITLRPTVPISQAPAPVITSQPATATLRGGKNLRGDMKWPPEDVKEKMDAENKARVELAKGPAVRPRKVHKDYSGFFAQHALNSTYPGYKVPPGTQYYEHHPVM